MKPNFIQPKMKKFMPTVEEAGKCFEADSFDYIRPKLWLGDFFAASNLEKIKENNIKSILTINSYPLSKNIYALENINIKFIEANDQPDEDLLSFFDDAYEFICHGLEMGGVLVHCYSGISRSATIVISFLMKSENWKLELAYKYAKSKRKIIEPNPGFFEQLKLFEMMQCSVIKTSFMYKMFKLQRLACKIRDNKIVLSSLPEILKCEPINSLTKLDPRILKCKKCRTIIAHVTNIIPHLPFHLCNPKDNYFKEDIENPGICEKIFFLEPLGWMTCIFSALEGRLNCPNPICKNKLGSFSWVTGCYCVCGVNMVPGFYVIPSRIDKENFIERKYERTHS